MFFYLSWFKWLRKHSVRLGASTEKSRRINRDSFFTWPSTQGNTTEIEEIMDEGGLIFFANLAFTNSTMWPRGWLI